MGDIERLVAAADDGTVDEIFLQHLSKGGELLSAGQTAEARGELEKAYQLQPKNPKAQNLLGLAYFKLNQFDRAAEIYELLVRDNPVDPTLRLNLGLVYLKANSLQRAVREFETAVDLAPDHKKAQNYLGLAYAQAGDFGRAKMCFVASGSITMAEKMERALKEPGAAPLVHAPEAARSEAAPAEAPRPAAAVPADHPAGPLGGPGGPAAFAEHPAPPATPGQPAAPASPARALTELTRSLSGGLEARLPFEVRERMVLVRVAGEVLCRLDGLVASSGSVSFVPEMKRFRGRATDKSFGEGERRMVRAQGEGTLAFAARERVFVPVELQDESAYFREDALFAFEETVVFENGRVPSKIAPDLHLVHLRGKGRALISAESALGAMKVTSAAPCTVPMRALVGWHGQLTPRITGISTDREGPPQLAGVELTGEGYVLFADCSVQPALKPALP